MENNLKLLTVSEFSDIIRLKKSAIYNLVYKRAIPFVKVGAKILFKMSDIEEYIDKNTHQSADQQIIEINTNRKIN